MGFQDIAAVAIEAKAFPCPLFGVLIGGDELRHPLEAAETAWDMGSG